VAKRAVIFFGVQVSQAQMSAALAGRERESVPKDPIALLLGWFTIAAFAALVGTWIFGYGP
jgi:hypothetical protein